MKVSVVMTTYNGKRYLTEMLDSLRNQTRIIDELLIFDDRSTDGSYDLIQYYIHKYELENWKVVLNDKNLGWERNFTHGIEAASGDVIFPCDQDDIWHTSKIEKMTSAFEENDNIWLLVSGYHAFSEYGGKMVTQQPVKTETTDRVSRVVFDEHYYQILRPGCTMAFKKEIMPLFRQLWSDGTPHDALLWGIASVQRKLYLYDDTLIKYRRHDKNASMSISHGYAYKVNEIERTEKVNTWFLENNLVQEPIKKMINSCGQWCKYRRKLLIDKKRVYWFRLWPYRNYYLTPKKYVGDLYYSFLK